MSAWISSRLRGASAGSASASSAGSASASSAGSASASSAGSASASWLGLGVLGGLGLGVLGRLGLGGGVQGLQLGGQAVQGILQLAVAGGLLVVELDQHLLHGAVALRVPDDGLAGVAGVVVGGVVGVLGLGIGQHLLILGLDVLVGGVDAVDHVGVQLLVDVAFQHLLVQGILGHAIALHGGDGLLPGLLVGGALLGEVGLVVLDIGLVVLGGLGLQVGHFLVGQLVQAQLGGLVLQHGVLDHVLQDVDLDLVGIGFDVQAVLGVVAGRGVVFGHGVFAPDDLAVAVLGHDLLLVIGLVQLHLGLQRLDLRVGLVQLRLQVALLRQRHRAAAQDQRQHQAQQLLHVHMHSLHFFSAGSRNIGLNYSIVGLKSQ